jgi:hypothetical protein
MTLDPIESNRPKNSYHLHGLAREAKFRQLELPPYFFLVFFSPPFGV